VQPSSVTIVWTWELNSNFPLKVWRMAITPTLKPYFALTRACISSAARADRALAKGGLSRKKGQSRSGIVNVTPYKARLATHQVFQQPSGVLPQSCSAVCAGLGNYSKSSSFRTLVFLAKPRGYL